MGHEIWHWAARLETFMERNCWAYDACAEEVWTEGGFTLAFYQRWGGGSEVLLEQVQLNFSLRNKFTILIPCDLLEEKNKFSKICFFKKSYWLHRLWWLWRPKCALLIIIESKAMLVILNCTLLHDQNAAWTVPYPYLMVCCKNIYLRMLFKGAYIAW